MAVFPHKDQYIYSIRFLYLIGVLFLLSCSKKEPEIRFRKTVIVYMSANNNLASNAFANINQMEEGFQGIDGKLIVYARIFGQEPAIYEISYDKGPQITSRKVKKYNDHDASDPRIMKMVFDDIKTLYPSESYAAILWSHATGWVPGSAVQRLKSFGNDQESKMDIQDLVTALPANLEYLIFDACSMASVEVLYELRNKAQYILAAPTEVLSVGLPYAQVEKHLFEPATTGLPKIAQGYYDHYMAKSGNEQSATFSLIKTSELEQLAQTTNFFLQQHSFVFPDYRRNEVQRLDFDPASPLAGFDFMDFFSKNFNNISLIELQKALSKAVIFKVNTPFFLGKPINSFSGLSCYIPSPENEWAHPFYRTLGWYRAGGFEKIF